MSDSQTLTTPSQLDRISSESLEEIAKLRFEARRLAAQLQQCEVELSDTRLQEQHLRASFAVAMAEREKIFSSQAWRAARTIQKAMTVAQSIFMPFLRLWKTPSKARLPPSPLYIAPSAPPLSYHDWEHTYGTLSARDRELIAVEIAKFSSKPLISFVIRNENAHSATFETTITAIRGQLYPHWEVCREDSAVTGTFLAILEPGSVLAEQALYEVALELQTHPDAALIYTDEDRIDDKGNLSDPVLKPAFSIDVELAFPLTGSFTVYRRSALEAMGLMPEDIFSKREESLALRVALHSGAAAVRHIPAVLCHRLVTEAETAFASDPTAKTVELATVAQELASVSISRSPDHPNWNRVTWPLPPDLPRVSVIIPTRDRTDLLARCVLGLLYRTDYPDLEILVVDNESVDVATQSLFRMLQTDPRVRVIPVPGSFNYSALNNAGAREATGDILLMLNNDVEVIDVAWLKEMVSHAVRPDVGAVGAKLLYADGRIQHAGVVLGVGKHNAEPGVAGHFGLSVESHEAGYLGQFAVTRELSAVTGACLALRRDVYEMVGGLNESALAISFNDVDLCLRIRAAGFRIIWTPFATLYHLESASRGIPRTKEQLNQAEREADYMRTTWGPLLDCDPFYNPAFDRKNHAFELTQLPRRRKPWDRAKRDESSNLSPR